MNRLLLLTGAAAMALCANADTHLYWRGTSANPVWDATTENWMLNGSPTAFYNSNTYARFDGVGAKDVTVDAGGVSTYVLYSEGTADHVLRGGNVSATYVFPYGGNLTICNTVSGYVFMRGGSLTVGDGGTLLASGFYPDVQDESGLNTRLAVMTGGVLRANIDANYISARYSTLYFDGGTLIHPTAADRQFGKTRILLGPGGMRVREDTAGQYTYIPGPIGTDVENDGGIWIEDHTGYMLLPNYASTYRGGIHILGSGGYVAVRNDSHLGKVPDAPTNNIFFANNSSGYSSLFVSHGNVTLDPNRDILISDGVKARIGAYNASYSWTIKSAISCEPAGTGKLELNALSDGAAAKPVAIETSGGRTNRVGALLVKAPAIIGAGTTLLEGAFAGLNDDAPMNISGNGHLMVTGGVLRLTQRQYVCSSGRFTISGGVVDFSSMEGREFLHAYNAPATTTVRDGGRLVASNIRMAGDNSSYYGNAANSVLNLETGGVLCVSSKIYIATDGKKGTLNFDGGMLEWANTNANYDISGGVGANTATRNGLAVNVLEGGAVISNNVAMWLYQPLRSGAAHDGGLTKWGAGELALFTTEHTFNGPIRVMEGSFTTAGSLTNPLNTNSTACVNAGCRFRMNTSYHKFARIEGSGSFVGIDDRNLTVWQAIAPGMGADALGTLTLDGCCNIEDGVALEIDVDENGNSDCLSYPAQLDLSKMTLKVNDGTKLNPNKKYVIASLPAGVVGEFMSCELPTGWMPCYFASAHELRLKHFRGTAITIK